MNDGYVNGYIQRRIGGTYEGTVSVDGINLGAIEAVYFQDNGKNYLWLKRKPIMEYDFDTSSYKTRKAEPRWEAYLEKQIEENVVAYKGEFYFMRFKYSIVGVWDVVLGKEKQRLNLFIERLPMAQQTILNGINERKRNEQNRRRD